MGTFYVTSGAPCSVEDYFNDSDFEGTPKLDTSIEGSGMVVVCARARWWDVSSFVPCVLLDDILSFSCSAVGNWTSASFTRKLSTGDKRDWGFDQVSVLVQVKRVLL
jgi:hypothetical protein